MNNERPILVKFRSDQHYINIRTVTRQRKSPSSIYLPHPSFTDLEADGHITIKDGNSFADFRLIDDGATVQIDFTWLSRYSDDTVKGYVQTVKLDYNTLANRIWDSLEGNDGPKTWSMLSVDRTKAQPRFDFQQATVALETVLSVPCLRRKLSRALRDNFQWPNNGDLVIRFYGDFDRYSFFFREYRGDKEGICGGLILDHHDGLEQATYSVHT